MIIVKSMCSDGITPPKPGSEAERAISTEVLLNLCSAISVNRYATSTVLEDLSTLLKISLSIRDDFIGPFKPFPDTIVERLASYSKIKSTSDLLRKINEYSQRSNEISEFVSSKMGSALPIAYDRFVLFLFWRPWNKNIEEPTVVEFGEKVKTAHRSIIRAGGVYEQSEYISNILSKRFKIAEQLKNETLNTLSDLFESFDHNNEKQYTKLIDIIKNHLIKLNEGIIETMQSLRVFKIRDILLKLSAVHKKLLETGEAIFNDEFKMWPSKNATTNTTLPLNNGTSSRAKQILKRFQTHSNLLLYFYVLLFFIFSLYLFSRFKKNRHILWKSYQRSM